MRIAIDVSPLESGHRVRGIGFYLENLKKSLLEYFPQNDYIFFRDIDELNDEVDIVHYPYFEPYFLSLPSKKKSTTVVTVHDLTPVVFKEHFPPGIKGNIRWLIQKNRLKNMDLVIADSQASKKDILKIAGLKDEKVKVVYLAASSDFKKIEIKEDERRNKKFNLPKNYLLYVGDVTWNKNLPRIISAVKKTKLPLVMVGKALVNEEYDKSNIWNADLVKVHKEIDGDKNFITLGFVSNEDLNYLYNNSLALLMPSIYEGFGLPVIEAMQAGCAVITSDAGSLKEVAEDAALYVDSNSKQSIASGIDRLKNNQKLREILIERGLKRAEEFSWKKTAQQTIKVYKSAAESK